MPKEEIKIFGGSTGKPFAQKMCDYIGIDLGKSEVFKFSDGNIFVKICETVRDNDVYLVQPIGLNPNDEFTEILFWMDAFKRASATSVTAIIPYFGYAKGDKKDEPRVSIRARVCAECIELAGADRIITMDLHSPQIQGFFKKPVDHLFALPILCNYVKSLNVEDLVVVSPDVGFAKQARNFATALQVPVAIGDKTRKSHDENAKVLEIIGNVKDKNVLIVDDFSISAGTLVDVARGLKERGAQRIFALVSHLMLSKSGAEKIENSPIELLISTDTVGNNSLASNKTKIVSVAPLFAEAVLRIHNKESVSSLFETELPSVFNKSLN
ncbi:ribose-phosphate diphosphokinase [Bacillus sp. FJAT-49711]|uniref:ribose-phosphate diphosphokinase n=1 Tax=Bacillus sp. FJAT-49711 TaxID=2833585 RepID=UPI001BCA43C1|nr:ribose-phosphate diphosphokinase [Bacillus sp. FJAT-49711]MBS4219950.1 ribose-phosphate diphosphokinase [Bacillus sp. FJAT-49711]